MNFNEFGNIVFNSDSAIGTVFKDAFKTKFDKHLKRKSVLGLDILKYSKYEESAQILIPYIFLKIIKNTIGNLRVYEPNFFTNFTEKNFKEIFINTGDGGFVIFDTPFHAIIFSIYFALNLQLYNTQKNITMKSLYGLVGHIAVRYALAKERIYKFENNWYGAAIITYARILAKDKLDRFLMDDEVKKWFDYHFNGIETLICLGVNNLEGKKIYNILFKKKPEVYNSMFFPQKGASPDKGLNSNIRVATLSKIGIVENKGDKISIYNFHMQVFIATKEPNGEEYKADKFIVTLGNLNVAGIEEKGN